MELVIFFAVFFFAVIVLGPIFGAEDRPAFRRPDRVPRMPVGRWFAGPPRR